MDETQRNKDAARRFVEGMGRDFAGTIDDAMAEDCRIVTQGTIPISGEALAAAGLVVQILPGGGCRRSSVRRPPRATAWRSRRNPSPCMCRASPYNNKYLFLMRFRDGKLIEMIECLDTELAGKFFGG